MARPSKDELFTDDNISGMFGGGVDATSTPRERPPRTNDALADRPRRVKNTQVINVSDIEADPDQPRKNFDQQALEQLGESLLDDGQLELIGVAPLGDGKFQILWGERRWRAATLKGVETLDAVVRKRPMSADDKFKLQYIENALREDLNPLEQAEAFQKLQDAKSCSQRELARELHCDVGTISRTLKLLDAPDDIKQRLVNGEISATAAHNLQKIDDVTEREHLLNAVLTGELSANELKETVSASNDTGKKKSKPRRYSVNAITFSVTSKRKLTNAEVADAARALAEKLESDGRSRRAA